MKVAILSESEGDEAILRIFVDALLGCVTQNVVLPLASRGWPSVLSILPKVITTLHYSTDADGLVVVVDSNHSPLDAACVSDRKKRTHRLQGLHDAIIATQSKLKPRPHGSPLGIAVGLAVPAIEAWLLIDRGLSISEAHWRDGLMTGQEPYSKNNLKKHVYGHDRPNLAQMLDVGCDAARRAIGHIPQLREKYPLGFGQLYAELSKWRT